MLTFDEAFDFGKMTGSQAKDITNLAKSYIPVDPLCFKIAWKKSFHKSLRLLEAKHEPEGEFRSIVWIVSRIETLLIQSSDRIKVWILLN